MIHQSRMTLLQTNMLSLTKEKLINLELISFLRHRISLELQITSQLMSKLSIILRDKTKISLNKKL
tara:strand:+ start:359 stop:556 length:198 start_codon:yes stop_codon:yes gene_type:complete